MRLRQLSASGNEPNGPHQGQLPSPEPGGQLPAEDGRVQHAMSVNEEQPKTSSVKSDVKPRPPDFSSEEKKEAGVCAPSLDGAGGSGINYDIEGGNSGDVQSADRITRAR